MQHPEAVTTTEPALHKPGAGTLLRVRALWALIGLASASVTFGVAELLSVLAGPSSAPLIAVSDATVALAPGWLANWAKTTLGSADKPFLLIGAGVVIALLSLGCGLQARRHTRSAQLAALALGAVAALAAGTRADATRLAVLPSVVGALAGALALGALAERLRTAQPLVGRPESEAGASPVERRAFLTATAVALGTGTATGGAGWLIRGASRGVDASRAALKLPAAVAANALPAGVDLGIPGVGPFRVPNPDFYRIDTALVVPLVTTKEWSLRIHGLVDREVHLDFQTLIASPLVERDVTLCCVSNEVGGDLIGNARWRGLPIAPLLAQAGPHSNADMVLSTSIDGWTASTPLQALTDGRDALLAVAMNGEPLPVEHGFPVRMVVPGLYGYVSATKWVVDLEVTRFDLKRAYWTSRGWSDLGPIKTQSRIDVPMSGTTVKPGVIAIAGVAWAQHRGIKAVEIRINQGPWRRAELAAEASIDTWRQWVYRWTATPGRYGIEVRATDGRGVVQTPEVAPPEPDGATGWHLIDVNVR